MAALGEPKLVALAGVRRRIEDQVDGRTAVEASALRFEAPSYAGLARQLAMREFKVKRILLSAAFASILLGAFAGSALSQTPDAGAKYCSVSAPSNWRDTFPVPNTWTWQDCRAFALASGAQNAQPLCVFQSGEPRFSLGDDKGGQPARNCGW
jgi:hypothetical protein